jgi:ribosomal protein S18 acetylase RimI-like enzyme
MEFTNKYSLEIRQIKEDELALIHDFAPPDWNTNLEKVYRQHYGQSYFQPLVAVEDTAIIATGMAVVHRNAAWLGTIIVKDGYRNRGIGGLITNELIESAKRKGVDTILLAATKLGLPVYTKAGFVHDLNYLFFKRDGPIAPDFKKENISRISPEDRDTIFALDLAVSGEDRRELLIHTMGTGYKYTRQGSIDGYFLPDFGKGLIIAGSDEAGLELLKFKISGDQTSVVVPETNRVAIEFLEANGYVHFQTSPRLYLNRNVIWDARRVYLRGSGYLG